MSQPNQKNNNFKDTKIFVGGLTWRTTTDDLKNFFQVRFGEVIDANVVSEGLPGGKLRSKGYGFVVFRNAESANTVCQLPGPVIDGRKTNVNMAYIGAKNNTNLSNQNGLLNQAGPSHQYQNGLFNQAASHQYQLASHNPNQHVPQPYWAPYYGHHPYMYNVPCYSYPTAMVSVQMHQYVLAYRMQRNWERLINQPSVKVSAPPNAPIVENNEDEADTETDSDQEGDINGEDNDINQDVNDQELGINEEDADTEADSDQEGEISAGEDNDIEQDVNDQELEINEEDADADTEAESDEGEISAGEDNDINQAVNDQDLEIMNGQEDDTKQEVDVTKQLANGVEVTLQCEIVCEEEAENTPQENGNGHEENGEQEEGEKKEYIKERVREAI
ncbi:clumping factor B [Brassica rapa]|uniref:clumping factor B n=1 Tax=Brassica campestris TaxID=3711 RepID=UPI0004F15486|nr:clumping factor B [Brassica rapa]